MTNKENRTKKDSLDFVHVRITTDVFVPMKKAAQLLEISGLKSRLQRSVKRRVPYRGPYYKARKVK
jgi:hypothetical protein